jgi:hypothetical protein
MGCEVHETAQQPQVQPIELQLLHPVRAFFPSLPSFGLLKAAAALRRRLFRFGSVLRLTARLCCPIPVAMWRYFISVSFSGRRVCCGPPCLLPILPALPQGERS